MPRKKPNIEGPPAADVGDPIEEQKRKLGAIIGPEY